jgi:CheY-like chemotaxis protein
MELKPPKSDFLLKTKHDIRNAMHVVVGMSKVLAISNPLTPPQKEIISALKKNADLSLKLVDSMFSFLQKGEVPIKFSLPQSAEPEPMAEEAVISEVSDRQRCILLVEDSAASALTAVSFLKELAYSCDVAKNGQDALAKFSAGRYSAIIMDVQIPGMDGLETTRRIRALEKMNNMKQTPILATTGNATEDDRLFCAKAGMNDYLSKPFDLKDLKIKLENIMRPSSI